MTAECPKCGNGKITTIWPLAGETRAAAYRNGVLKVICFEGHHEFELLLPEFPEKINRFLNEAFPEDRQAPRRPNSNHNATR